MWAAGDVTKQMKFISPDDGNADDRTVFEIALPKPLAPGAQIQFRIHFVAKFPEVVARTGYKRDFLMAGQWFPKVGVWWNGAWNCHQFHAQHRVLRRLWHLRREADAAGEMERGLQRRADRGQGQRRWHADGELPRGRHPRLCLDGRRRTTKVVEDSIELSGGTVKIRMLMQPGHMASAPRYMQALKGTMRKFDEWIGAYPYPQITVVDPPHGGAAAGGMEYPTLITADTTWWMPKSILEPEAVVEHEFGHQYWYGMVATNEFEDAWMDEGINQYMEAKVMDALYGEDTSSMNSRLGTLGERGADRMAYVPMADRDPLSRPAWLFENGESYGGISYSKTALMMLTLESLIGEKTVLHGLHEYFERYKFKHPTPEQFTAAMNEAVGQNLDWYWKQAIYGTETLDDRILSASSERVDWYSTQEEKKGVNRLSQRGGRAPARHLRPAGGAGGEVRRRLGGARAWDGKDRWHRFSWDRKAKLVSAEVDPDHGYWLDRDPLQQQLDG